MMNVVDGGRGDGTTDSSAPSLPTPAVQGMDLQPKQPEDLSHSRPLPAQ